jgi:hypothetical protein
MNGFAPTGMDATIDRMEVIRRPVEPGLEEEMSPNIPWSDEEDQYLRDLAKSGLSLTEIAHQMRRGVSSVRGRALKITVAIARDRNPMQTHKNHPSDSRVRAESKTK